MRLFPLFLALAACKPGGPDVTDPFAPYDDADLTAATTVTDLVSTASAPNAYTLAVLLVAALDPENLCPAATVDGDTTTYTGGCTDDDGDVWEGTATVTSTDGESGTVTYEGFGLTSHLDCDGTTETRSVLDGDVTLGADGSFSVRLTGAGDVDDEEACTTRAQTFAIEYDGTRVDESDTISRWNGSGRYGTSLYGKASISTSDEVLDDEGCDTEAQSGTTTLAAGEHTAVITYDGAVDCDPNSTVTWTLDGADQGELVGVSCQTGRGAAWLGVLALLGLRRRGATPPGRSPSRRRRPAPAPRG